MLGAALPFHGSLSLVRGMFSNAFQGIERLAKEAIKRTVLTISKTKFVCGTVGYVFSPLFLFFIVITCEAAESYRVHHFQASSPQHQVNWCDHPHGPLQGFASSLAEPVPGRALLLPLVSPAPGTAVVLSVSLGVTSRDASWQ